MNPGEVNSVLCPAVVLGDVYNLYLLCADSCDVAHIMRNHTAACRGRYNVFDEEKRKFGIGWSVEENGTGDWRLAETFKYHSMVELQVREIRYDRLLVNGIIF